MTSVDVKIALFPARAGLPAGLRTNFNSARFTPSQARDADFVLTSRPSARNYFS